MKKVTQILMVLAVALCCNLDAIAQSKHIAKIDKFLAKGDTNKALTKLNQYISKDPNEAELYLKRAKLKIEAGDYDPAMVDLNSFCSINKACTEADYLKGLVRYYQGDYNGAISHLSEYTKKKEDAQGWFYLALSHMWLQNYTLSKYAFSKSLEVNPNQPDALYNSGLCAFYSEEFQESLDFFTQCLALREGDKDAMLGKALAYTRLEDHVESNKVLRSILENHPDDGVSLYNIGVNYFHLKESDLACDYWNRALEAGHAPAAQIIEKYCDEKSGKGSKK